MEESHADSVEEALVQALLLPLEDQIRLLKDLIRMYAERGGNLQSPSITRAMELAKKLWIEIETEEANASL